MSGPLLILNHFKSDSQTGLVGTIDLTNFQPFDRE